MEENPYFWLRTFALDFLPAYLLHESSELFDAAGKEKGQLHLHSLAERFALANQQEVPPAKCLQLDYVTQYEDMEALFLNVFPCLQLSQLPVHLAALRLKGKSSCRLFRLHYPHTDHLYLSELHLEDHPPSKAGLPDYEKAVSLIFSYTLATPYHTEEDLSTPVKPEDILPDFNQEAGAV